MKYLIIIFLLFNLSPLNAQESNAKIALTDSKKMNLKISPFGLFVNWYNVELDFGINNDWTIGPDVSYVSFNNVNSTNVSERLNLYKLGVRANYFITSTRTLSGFYLGLSLSMIKAELSSSRLSNTYRLQSDGLEMRNILGYQMFFNNSLNLGFGIGSSFTHFSDTKMVNNGILTNLFPSRNSFNTLALETTLGYLF